MSLLCPHRRLQVFSVKKYWMKELNIVKYKQWYGQAAVLKDVFLSNIVFFYRNLLFVRENPNIYTFKILKGCLWSRIVILTQNKTILFLKNSY